MATKLNKRSVVIVGGGLTAALVARQLTAKGTDVLVLERGVDRRKAAEAKIPNQRDELRWDIRGGLGQDWAVETYTVRHSRNEDALPARRLGAFLPGEGLGGAASHWNGFTWRWSEYDPTLRTRFETRYGKSAIPADLLIQDWGVTYAEMEPHHHLFEKLFGISGKAGNINGKIQSGGNPFEAPRRDDYPQPPVQPTEAGLIFKGACEKLGYKPFIAPSGNSSGTYTNPDGMKLGQCQYCGHCERFICEAQAKATPDALLYPVLFQRKNFEIRLQCRVLGVDYDREAKRVLGVRYVDLITGEEYEQPADVVVLAAFTMSNTRFLLMGGIGAPYNPATGEGVVGKNFCIRPIRRSISSSGIAGSIRSSPAAAPASASTNSTTTISIIPVSDSLAAAESVPISRTGVPSAVGACRRGRRVGARNGRKRMPPGTPTRSRSKFKARAIRIARTISISIRSTMTSMVSRWCASPSIGATTI